MYYACAMYVLCSCLYEFIMEAILSVFAESFTGAIDRKLGYSMRRNGRRFFSVRNAHRIVPPYGHWQFIVRMAKLATARVYIYDIRVSVAELDEAIQEAGLGHKGFAPYIGHDYTAEDVLRLKKAHGL